MADATSDNSSTATADQDTETQNVLTGDTTDGGVDSTDATSDDADPEGADKLGDPGKKALDSMKSRLKGERERRRVAEAELEKLRNGATKTDDDTPDLDRVRRDAEEAATSKANKRIVRSEIRAAAAGKLADPNDALAFLDLDQFEVDDNGEVDSEEITEAIADLLVRKPHLAAAQVPQRRFQGTADGGPRGGRQKTLDQLIQAAEQTGDWKTARQLKLRKLTSK